MSVSGYLGIMIVTIIPLIGLIMLFKWSFGPNTNKNKRNLAKAYLILIILGFISYVLFGTVILNAFYELM